MSATSTGRKTGLDVARGVLLVAMVAVHLLSAHGTAPQVGVLHGWVGVFLISSGFVGLSGYVVGMRGPGALPRRMFRGLDRGLQLLLVMFAYGALLSLMRHGLLLLGDGAQSCAARFGWLPPLRFDDLGILLPIALVQIFGPVASARGRWVLPVLGALALLWMLLPELTAAGDNVIVDVLARRTLTPFYTVSTFVAIGLVGVLLARARLRFLDDDAGAPAVSVASLGIAIALSLPPCSRAILDPIYRAAGPIAGTSMTLVYWSGVLLLFLRGFTTPWGVGPQSLRALFALIGRNSLLVFVLHDFLLVLDAFARDLLGLDKGLAVVLVLLASNVAVLGAAARLVERSRLARTWLDGLLLGRSRPGSLLGGGAFSLSGGVALAIILALYTSSALARPDAALVIDDFEHATCPQWWTFGFAPQQRLDAGASQGQHHLQIRGAAPGTYAHGRGVFLDRDIGSRRTLELLVRGEGPGSGRIKIELCEDDNGNWEIEKDPPLYIPKHDDRFIHELSVDWRGWRTVRLPLASFRDDNPQRGNDTLDPQRDLTSGGMLELQLLFSPTGTFEDEVRIAIDHIRFTP